MPMLTLMVVGFFAFIGVLEVIRSFIVIRIGSQLERRFNLRVYKAAFERDLGRAERLVEQPEHREPACGVRPHEDVVLEGDFDCMIRACPSAALRAGLRAA
jgi:hypothetical protein